MEINYNTIDDNKRMNTFSDMIESMKTTYLKKHKDYGLSFEKSFYEYGPYASTIRIEDKINRFKNLTKEKSINDIIGETGLVNESLYDTLLDCANYLVMMATELKMYESSK